MQTSRTQNKTLKSKKCISEFLSILVALTCFLVQTPKIYSDENFGRKLFMHKGPLMGAYSYYIYDI